MIKPEACLRHNRRRMQAMRTFSRSQNLIKFWLVPESSAKCRQVDANSDPHPIHRRFASVNRPPPFLGRKTKVAIHSPPPERGRMRAHISASRWGSNPELAI